jgi:hypothetical protein
MSAITRTPPTTERVPNNNDPERRAANPPRNAGIAAKTAIECVVTGFAHDWQLMMRPGPRPALRPRLIAGRPQWGHLTIGVMPNEMMLTGGPLRRAQPQHAGRPR